MQKELFDRYPNQIILFVQIKIFLFNHKFLLKTAMRVFLVLRGAIARADCIPLPPAGFVQPHRLLHSEKQRMVAQSRAGID
jgi:hypothetical protein